MDGMVLRTSMDKALKYTSNDIILIVKALH